MPKLSAVGNNYTEKKMREAKKARIGGFMGILGGITILFSTSLVDELSYTIFGGVVLILGVVILYLSTMEVNQIQSIGI